MSTLNDLLRQVEQQDSQLAADIRQEVKALASRRAFGLNFERHVPETVELPGRAVRKGDKVRFLPERAEPESSVDRGLWLVASIRRDGKRRVADLIRKSRAGDAPETASRAVDDLIVVAEFRDPIYPGLVSTGKVERGGDKPYHSVINAENFHALHALLYTHEGKVDAIYIDPPYNSGAKDWKYNNDYVDGEDAYRHSKWLAFIERRLKLAKRLLNPENSVLIVTIDEREYLRLGLLLEQTFAEARMQMVSSVINHSGVARAKEFYRADEYLFFVFFGEAAVIPTGEDMLNPPESFEGKKIDIWNRLLRRGTDARREDSEKQFYPFWVDPEKKRIHSVGDYIPLGKSPDSVDPPEPGLMACWPIRLDESEGRWQISADTARTGLNEGTVRLGAYSKKRKRWSVSYLRNAEKQRIKRGEIEVTGKDENGALILKFSETVTRVKYPVTVWNQRSHNAGAGGSNIIRALLPGRRFPFPKSLYAVEDALSFFVAVNPDAVVVDFFSGSGTTAHAVMRLNKQDGGNRQCISVTNNEVSADEQKGLRKQGLRPGDPHWEQWGICDYITKPRIRAAITGQTPEGEPIKGDYKFTDEFPMADGFKENVEFFTLTYEAPRPVAHHKSFDAIAPLLWLKAGAQGRRIDKATDTFDIADTYAVLFDLDALDGFLSALGEAEAVRMAFIVTDDDRGFQAVCGELPDHVEAVRLYASYLTNFTINTGRD